MVGQRLCIPHQVRLGRSGTARIAAENRRQHLGAGQRDGPRAPAVQHRKVQAREFGVFRFFGRFRREMAYDDRRYRQHIVCDIFFV